MRNLTTIIISQANLILNTSSKKDNKLKKLNTHNQKNRSYELKEKLSTNLIIVCNYNFIYPYLILKIHVLFNLSRKSKLCKIYVSC